VGLVNFMIMLLDWVFIEAVLMPVPRGKVRLTISRSQNRWLEEEPVSITHDVIY